MEHDIEQETNMVHQHRPYREMSKTHTKHRTYVSTYVRPTYCAPPQVRTYVSTYVRLTYCAPPQVRTYIGTYIRPTYCAGHKHGTKVRRASTPEKTNDVCGRRPISLAVTTPYVDRPIHGLA